MLFEPWAVQKTWPYFVRLACLVEALPKFCLDDWETENPVPAARGNSFKSRVLARRLISALVLVQTLLGDMKRENRRAWKAARSHLDRAHSQDDEGLAHAKRYVYDWLRQRAQIDGVRAAS